MNRNVSALRAQRALRAADSEWQRSIQRLSSGMRINGASDDAAGLSISTSLRAKSRVYSQAERNINDGISALNVAQGGVSQLGDLVTRMQELAAQNSNGTYSNAQRATGDTEFQALADEFNRLVEATSFNGLSLLNLSLDEMRIQAGFGTEGSLSLRLNSKLSHARGLGTFGTASTPTATSSYGTAAGDLNGDGITDLVSLASAGGQITVQLGDGRGGFSTSQTFTPVGGTGRDIVLADFNGDGTLDLAAVIGGSNATIRYGLGNGTFDSVGATITGINSTGPMVAADFDNDGDIDLGGASAATGLKWAANDGAGNFSAPIIFTGNSNISSNFQVADFDHDGVNDILGVTTGVVSFIRGTGGGGFSFVGNYAFAGAADVQVGDFNGDGNFDFAVTSSSSTNIGLYRGDGSGGFASYATLSAQAASARLLKGDTNGDGIDDLVALPSGSSSGSLFTGNSDGTFDAAVALNTGAGLRQGVLADFNNDGVLDLAGGSTTGVKVVLQNTYQTSQIEVMDISTLTGAREAFTMLNRIRDRISGELGMIGSFQSRLASALNSVANTRLNYDQANSRILDADMAAESANAIRTSILRQAATSVLAQANLQPTIALALLRQ